MLGTGNTTVLSKNSGQGRAYREGCGVGGGGGWEEELLTHLISFSQVNYFILSSPNRDASVGTTPSFPSDFKIKITLVLAITVTLAQVDDK